MSVGIVPRSIKISFLTSLKMSAEKLNPFNILTSIPAFHFSPTSHVRFGLAYLFHTGPELVCVWLPVPVVNPAPELVRFSRNVKRPAPVWSLPTSPHDALILNCGMMFLSGSQNFSSDRLYPIATEGKKPNFLFFGKFQNHCSQS